MKFIFKSISVVFLITIIVLVALLFTPDALKNTQIVSPEIPSETTTEQFETTQISNISYTLDNANDIYVVKFSEPIKIKYDTSGETSFRNNALLSNFKIAINGGYFRDDLTHAGLLAFDGEIIESLARTDTQVTHVVVFNSTTNSLDVLLAKDFNLDLALDKNNLLFQTGPLVIQSNNIQNDFIENSLNGSGKYRRSLLGFTENGEKFFVATRRTFDLKTLAQKILEFPVFQNTKISVVNLDGGSSVALYAKDNEDFTFGTARELPIILGVPNAD